MMGCITDELREWAKTLTHWWYDPVKDEYTYTTGIMPPSIDAIRLDSSIIAIADRIDAEHERAARYERCAFWHDANDDELEKYGLLREPIDADGVPICVGDVVDVTPTDKFTGHKNVVVTSVIFKRSAVLVTVDTDDRLFTFMPNRIRHHHAPTVEDVLREIVHKCQPTYSKDGSYTTGLTKEEFAEYAAKLHAIIEGSKGPEWQETDSQDEGR